MPYVYWGYGFLIGDRAATDIANGWCHLPGGAGFAIGCGVWLPAADLDRAQLAPHLAEVMDDLDTAIPRGFRRGGIWQVSQAELGAILADGAAHAVARAHGVARDLQRCEDGGRVEGAKPEFVGARAHERGLAQVGSPGSGNHSLEAQAVAEIYDDESAAATFGLCAEQVCVTSYCGSRGLGHQCVATTYSGWMRRWHPLWHPCTRPQISLRPVDSIEGWTILRPPRTASQCRDIRSGRAPAGRRLPRLSPP